jgi:hypothetical protein
MQTNPLDYDSAALKTRYIARHGTDIGTLVFDAETNRRRILDERSSALATELSAVMAQLSQRQAAAGQAQAEWQARIGAAFLPY